jgi:[protein-PII] uridylyltransferase
MEVAATDRPGLLSRIAKAITDSDIRLQNAKISTIGAQAEDVFFITDLQDQPIQDAAKRKEIRKRITQYLDMDN